MNTAALTRISEFFARVASMLSSLRGIGFWFFLAGFTVLAIIAAVLLLKLFIMAIRAIPNMTVRQFVKFMLILAIVLMISGIFL